MLRTIVGVIVGYLVMVILVFVTFSIAYLTVNSSSGSGMLDWDWLNAIEPASESGFLRHLRLDRPLEVLVDGRNGKGVVLIGEE